MWSSTDSVGHSFVGSDVADSYWKILRHVPFCIFSSLARGGSFSYYDDRDYRLTSTWDALYGPMLTGMLSLGEEIIALFCTITLTLMSFVLAKARPWSN